MAESISKYPLTNKDDRGISGEMCNEGEIDEKASSDLEDVLNQGKVKEAGNEFQKYAEANVKFDKFSADGSTNMYF